MEDKRLIFYSLLDFYPKRESIRLIYDELDLKHKQIYKMYVYSLPWMDDDIKDLIWEYLNEWEEGIFDLARKYRIKKAKAEKRVMNEIHNTEEDEQLE